MGKHLHIGLLINPLAGLGGSLALKGSDGPGLRELIQQQPSPVSYRAEERAGRALAVLRASGVELRFSCWAGVMGERALLGCGYDPAVLGAPVADLSTARDTALAASALCAAGIDILLFVGGDGTARDILDVVGTTRPVLGVPAGVKMHSGVFAISPEAAGELLLKLASGALVGLRNAEVRDVDEQAFQQGIVRSRFHGELLVPGDSHFLQHTKIGGREDARLAAADIASWQAERMQAHHTYLIGPGSTTAALMRELALDNTLLGVDVVRDGELLAADVDEAGLLQQLAAAPGPAHVVVTPIAGQGHLFGRGNQQFSPAVIRAVGLDNIVVLATKAKIAGLEGRPLLVDTNDRDLDLALCGFRAIITGYEDQLLYRVSAG